MADSKVKFGKKLEGRFELTIDGFLYNSGVQGHWC